MSRRVQQTNGVAVSVRRRAIVDRSQRVSGRYAVSSHLSASRLAKQPEPANLVRAIHHAHRVRAQSSDIDFVRILRQRSQLPLSGRVLLAVGAHVLLLAIVNAKDSLPMQRQTNVSVVGRSRFRVRLGLSQSVSGLCQNLVHPMGVRERRHRLARLAVPIVVQ